MANQAIEPILLEFHQYIQAADILMNSLSAHLTPIDAARWDDAMTGWETLLAQLRSR